MKYKSYFLPRATWTRTYDQLKYFEKEYFPEVLPHLSLIKFMLSNIIYNLKFINPKSILSEPGPFYPWGLIKNINFCKTWCRGLGLVVVDALISKLFCTCKPVQISSCIVDVSVGHYLNHLATLCRTVCENFPLVEVFLWVKLNSKERIIFGFHNCNKIFIVWSCSAGYHIPETFQSLVLVKCG